MTLRVDLLPQWLEALRRERFSLTRDRIASVYELLAILTVEGRQPKSPEEFGQLIGPLVCSTPAEQRAFQLYSTAWGATLFAELSPIRPTPPIVEELKGDLKSEEGRSW